jgi:hypothetical protein
MPMSRKKRCVLLSLVDYAVCLVPHDHPKPLSHPPHYSPESLLATPALSVQATPSSSRTHQAHPLLSAITHHVRVPAQTNRLETAIEGTFARRSEYAFPLLAGRGGIEPPASREECQPNTKNAERTHSPPLYPKHPAHETSPYPRVASPLVVCARRDCLVSST